MPLKCVISTQQQCLSQWCECGAGLSLFFLTNGRREWFELFETLIQFGELSDIDIIYFNVKLKKKKKKSNPVAPPNLKL